MKDAVIPIPSWAWGGKPRKLHEVCQWRMQRVDDEESLWRVRLEERATGKPGRLVELNKVADAQNIDKPKVLSILNYLKQPVVVLSEDAERKVEAIVDRLMAASESTPYPWANGLVLLNQSVSPTDIEDCIRKSMEGLLERFPNGALFVVRQSRAIHFRVTVMRILLLANEREIDLERKPNPDTFEGFSPAKFIAQDYLYGLYAYLTPALLAASPYVWALLAPRIDGALVYTFGEAIKGGKPEQCDILHQFAPSRRHHSGLECPRVEPTAYHELLRWWIAQLDQLFTEVTDPVLAVRQDGSFDARMALGTFLTVEQAFRNVQASLAHESDSHTRLLLCFDTLDTLAGLRLLDFDSMCELSRARKELAELERTVPSDVAEVLLPRARAAVTALQETQDGFFLKARRGNDGLSLPSKGGRSESVVSMERATSFYLRMRRNAGHGFNGKHDLGYPRDQALLASHTGELPHNLADLAYLYLLRLIAKPELLAQGLGDRS